MTSKPSLIYFGTPDFSATILEAVINDTDCPYQVTAVVTQPDQPVGRNHIITPSPVALVALKYNLPTYKPDKLNSGNLVHIKIHKPEVFLVVSYGNFIPNDWLSLPVFGALNIHFSLLPKYRGALCISETIKNQDPMTGVTLMLIDEQMDHGPIITQEIINIDINDNTLSLTNKLTQEAVTLLHHWLPKIYSKDFTVTSQDDHQATYTPKAGSHTRTNAFISWQELEEATKDGQNASRLHALIRSNSPEPGAWTKIKDLEIKLIKTSLVNGRLVIDLVQLPGKNPINWEQFISRWK